MIHRAIIEQNGAIRMVVAGRTEDDALSAAISNGADPAFCPVVTSDVNPNSHYHNGVSVESRPILPNLQSGVVDMPFPPARIRVLFNGKAVDDWQVTDSLSFVLQDAGRWTVMAYDAFPFADRTYEITV